MLRRSFASAIAALALVAGVAVPAHAAPGDDLVVIGDSYSSGFLGYGEGANGWPAIVADRFDLRLQLNAVPGTGYAKNTPGEADTFRDRCADRVTASTDIVIVAGSRNDKSANPTTIRTNTGAVADCIKRIAPNATIVYVGPMWAGDEPTYAQPIEDAVRTAATAKGYRFVDGSHWLSYHPTLITQGHPTNGGHAVLAKYIGDALAAELTR